MIATALNSLERYAQWTEIYIERIQPGDYVALVLAHCPNGYKFDFTEANSIKDKPIVVLDFREYGWNTSFKNCDLAGFQREEQPMYSGDEWILLDGWLKGQNIVAYFKREFSPEVGQLVPPFPVYPIDLISGRNGASVEFTSKDEYMNRPSGVMHWWGYSHEDRVYLHNALKDSGLPSLCSCRNIPHFERMALAKVLEAQKQFLLSCALPGCGWKTFRTSESCVNCVPVVPDCGMVYSVPWTQDNAVLIPTVDGRIDPQDSVQRIVAALQDKETLWEKYQNAQVSAMKLNQDNYMREIINPLIQAAL